MPITLATLPKATAQEVFDQVAIHLLTQNKVSREGAQCLYQGNNGLKCAAGCLISYEEYNPMFEAKAWNALINEYRIPDNHQGLIEELQRLHDIDPVRHWEEGLYIIASYRNLSAQAITDFVQKKKDEGHDE